MYQSLAKLIKLCDDVLLQGEKALDKENVADVIQLLEDAVQVTMSTYWVIILLSLRLYLNNILIKYVIYSAQSNNSN